MKGLSERKIARETGKERNTVHKYIKQYQQSRHKNIEDLPITEEVLSKPTYKKRHGKRRALTKEVKTKLKKFIKDNK